MLDAGQENNRSLWNTMVTHPPYRLPKFAIPVMIIIQDKPFGMDSGIWVPTQGDNADISSELTPSRKIMKTELRKLAQRKWEERLRNTGSEPFAHLWILNFVARDTKEGYDSLYTSNDEKIYDFLLLVSHVFIKIKLIGADSFAGVHRSRHVESRLTIKNLPQLPRSNLWLCSLDCSHMKHYFSMIHDALLTILLFKWDSATLHFTGLDG